MREVNGLRGRRYWIGVVFFLLAAAPGCWVPVLSNVMTAQGFGPWIWVAFLGPQVAGILSPMVFAAQADQRFSAEKILALTIGGGSVILFAAFWCLGNVGNPWWFIGLMFLNALVTAPAWSLLTAVAFANLDAKGGNFGSFRVWGTFGWMMAGWLVSWLGFDTSAASGMLSAGVRVLAGIACLFLPATPPRGRSPMSLGSALGLDALQILKNRDQAVYFATAFLFSVPLSAFYMHTPLHLEDLGVEKVAGAMSVGQAVEVVAMVVMGAVMARARVKVLLLAAMLCGTVRYGLYAVGAQTGNFGWVVAGIGLQGICWTFFFETGRVFVNRRSPEGLRAQTQALLGLVTGGLGGITGTLVVGYLHSLMVTGAVGGWQGYWLVLTAMCAGATVFFAVGYRGLAAAADEQR